MLLDTVCRSPVSPVFHTVVTVRIGLKTKLEWEHPFQNINNLTLCRVIVFYFGTRVVKGRISD